MQTSSQWRNSHIGKFGLYIASGLLSTGSHYVAMFAMIKAGGIEPTAASALGFCVGALVKYILNYFLAFRSTQPHRAATIRFVAATGALLGLNTAIFWVLQSGVGVHYAAAQLIATGLVVPIGYVVSRYWVFE